MYASYLLVALGRSLELGRPDEEVVNEGAEVPGVRVVHREVPTDHGRRFLQQASFGTAKTGTDT